MTVRGKILLVVISIVVAVASGTVGYVIIEDQSFLQSLYMTIITITSVGYGEVFELSQTGRYLTMVLCVVGLIVMVGSVTVLTSVLVETQLPQIWQRNRMKRRIQQLQDHVIICGAGDMAMVIIEEMIDKETPFVVVDDDQQVLDDLMEKMPDILVYHGDATEDDTLNEVGIDRAWGLISTLPSDAENLFVCLAARELNRDLEIVTRIEQQENRKRMEKAGADSVISPRVTGGQRMANLILQPDIVSFLDVIHQERTGTYRLEKVPIGEQSEFTGKTLEEANIPSRTGLIVISRLAADASGQMEFNPTSSTPLHAGDELLVLGRPEQIQQLRELTDGTTE